MIRIKVFFNSTLHHFSQMLTGLEYLSQKGEIDLEYELDLGRFPADIFRLEIDGKNVFFDMADNSRIYNSIYNQCDFYVKRMLLKSDAGEMDKLIAYGLYYPVYYENKTLKYLFLKNSKLLKYSLKYWKIFSALLNVRDSIAVNELDRLESPPCPNNTVIFGARLWNPANNETQWKKEERDVLNQQRIETIRLLKKRLPENFAGGILEDDYSREICPDLLLESQDYHRKTYLRKLKKSSMGIANQGLEDSIGAKIGEYVAHSLAVLTTSLDKFVIPGNFKVGENYLVYDSPEDCLEIIEMLLDNRELRTRMQLNNQAYYKDCLHPGQKIRHIINDINL